LKEPEFHSRGLYYEEKARITDQATNQVKKLILVMHKELTGNELMQIFKIKHNKTFRVEIIFIRHPWAYG